jgi:propionate CoA-transferase
VAPGIDIERDIFAQMAFAPRLAHDLRSMEARLFAAGPMGLAGQTRPQTRP